jgi:predicted membrane protein
LELSSPRFKALAVTAGSTLWFFIITSTTGIFSFYALIAFLAVIITLTQVFSLKLSKGLDVFAIINTKIFLGSLFVSVFTIYGILFKILRIDLLRLKKQHDSYWLQTEQLKSDRIFKQY